MQRLRYRRKTITGIGGSRQLRSISHRNRHRLRRSIAWSASRKPDPERKYKSGLSVSG